MSIKNQLRAAILSGGATASAPGGKAIDFQGDTFTAPSDGYVCYGVRATAPNQWLSIYSTGVESTSSITNEGQNPALFVPVRKGQQVNLNRDSSCVVNYRRFIKLVGGGKNPVAQLIRRVVSCLRSTFDQCLSRTVDRIRACQRQLGLYTKRQRLTLMRRSAMSLKRMVGVQSKRTVRVTQHMLSATSRWSRSRLQQVLSEVGGLACLSKRRRAIHTCIALQQATEDQRRLPWSYSRTLVRNLVLGGASHA